MKRLLSILIPVNRFLNELLFMLLIFAVAGIAIPVLVELIGENTEFYATVQQLIIK